MSKATTYVGNVAITACRTQTLGADTWYAAVHIDGSVFLEIYVTAAKRITAIREVYKKAKTALRLLHNSDVYIPERSAVPTDFLRGILLVNYDTKPMFVTDLEVYTPEAKYHLQQQAVGAYSLEYDHPLSKRGWNTSLCHHFDPSGKFTAYNRAAADAFLAMRKELRDARKREEEQEAEERKKQAEKAEREAAYRRWLIDKYRGAHFTRTPAPSVGEGVVGRAYKGLVVAKDPLSRSPEFWIVHQASGRVLHKKQCGYSSFAEARMVACRAAAIIDFTQDAETLKKTTTAEQKLNLLRILESPYGEFAGMEEMEEGH